MAQITITTTTEQDDAIKAATDRSNAELLQVNPRAVLETPVQFFKRAIDHRLDAWVKENADRSRETRLERYRALSDEDKARVDAILSAR